MPMFDVFVDGPTNDTPAARQSLAEAMSKRYGLGVPDLLARMEKGKFRVKANLDEDTAKKYAGDLESIGARVSIAESKATGPVPVAQRPPDSGPNRAKSLSVRPPAAPPPGTAKEVVRQSSTAAPASRPTLPPSNAARPATSSLPPASTARPQPGSSLPPANASRPPPGSSLPPPTAARTSTTSGLSAAYASAPATGLGALDGEALSLAALDGSDDGQPSAQGSFAPPEDVLPASIGPAPAKAPAPKAARPKDVPLDLFAPPEEGGNELEVALSLAVEESPRKRASTPVPISGTPATGVVATPVLQRKSGPVGRPEPVVGVVAAEAPRWRFAAGVLIAVVLGFLPAHLIASARESSAFEKIDAHVTQVQEAVGRADAPVPYEKLDEFRAQQLSRKEKEQRNIALLALVMWAAIGSGIAYVWFRKIRWKT